MDDYDWRDFKARNGGIVGARAAFERACEALFRRMYPDVTVQGNANTVTKLRASDGALLGTFPVGVNPVGVTFDGTSIWVANQDSNNVNRLRPSDGKITGTFAVGSKPQFIAFDGTNLWVTNLGSNNITELRDCDGALLGTFPTGDGPVGIVFDGANFWTANNSGSTSKR